MAKSLNDRIVNTVVNGIMGIALLLFVTPLLYVLANSFSSPFEVYSGNVFFWPVNFTLRTYEQLLRPENNIVRSFFNSVYYGVLDAFVTVFLLFMTAYPLTKRDLKYKGFFVGLMVAAVYLNGGMIPTYLVVRGLGMIDTPWALIFPGCLGMMNIIVIRTFIKTSISESMVEAARLDGTTEMQLLVKIIIPLSVPVLSMQLLIQFVGQWNSYFGAMIYLQTPSKYPIQLVMKNILISTGTTGGGGMIDGSFDMDTAEIYYMAEAMKYAVIVVSTLPILIIFPFFAKYFEKGVMIGGLKD